MFFTKVKSFLIEPSKTFELSREDTFGETLKYYLRIAAIYSGFLIILFTFSHALFGLDKNYRLYMLLIISEIMMMSISYFFVGLLLIISRLSMSLPGHPLIPLGITGIKSNSLIYAYIMISTSLLSIIIGIFVMGALIHFFVYLLGGRKGFVQTAKALMYGSTPGLIFGWIPVINIIAILLSLDYQITGIRKLQGISTIRATAAVLMPSMAVAFLVGLLMLYTALPG